MFWGDNKFLEPIYVERCSRRIDVLTDQLCKGRVKSTVRIMRGEYCDYMSHDEHILDMQTTAEISCFQEEMAVLKVWTQL